MIKDKLLSGMNDTELRSELQLNEDMSLETVASKVRAKETILKQITSESMVAAGTSLPKFGATKK